MYLAWAEIFSVTFDVAILQCFATIMVIPIRFEMVITEI